MEEIIKGVLSRDVRSIDKRELVEIIIVMGRELTKMKERVSKLEQDNSFKQRIG